MKRFPILLVVMVSFLALPLASNSAVATVGDVWDYDTGIKVTGTDALVTLTWVGEACKPAYVHGNTVLEIEYSHTTPKNAQPGSFDLPATIGETFEYENGEWVWYGSAQFWSHINPDAKRGVNHGHITITWYNGDVWSWSFNVMHKA